MTKSRHGGFWVFLATLTLATLALAACGGSGTSAPPPSASVTVSPTFAALAATTQTQQFSATVSGNVTNLSVSWSVDGVSGGNATAGTISAAGLYTPPTTAGSHQIVAASVALPASTASASVTVTDLAGVFTYHNNLARDGTNTQEYALTPANVTSATFGKLTSCPADGAVYTQPLWVPGVHFVDGPHNVIVVATQHDSLIAFDADAVPCLARWSVNLLDTMHGGTAGETSIIWNDVGYCLGDVYPEVGVTGTPVIDPTTNTVYVVSSSEVGTAGGNCSYSPGTFYRRLHAIDLATGNEKFNGPVTITASVAGVGDGGSVVNFHPQNTSSAVRIIAGRGQGIRALVGARRCNALSRLAVRLFRVRFVAGSKRVQYDSERRPGRHLGGRRRSGGRQRRRRLRVDGKRHLRGEFHERAFQRLWRQPSEAAAIQRQHVQWRESQSDRLVYPLRSRYPRAK